MKVTYEFSLADFKAWCGGSDTLEKIRKFDITHPGAMEQAQQYIEDCLGEEATETEINDMLWFEDDAILEAIDYSNEEDADEWDDENGFEAEAL